MWSSRSLEHSLIFKKIINFDIYFIDPNHHWAFTMGQKMSYMWNGVEICHHLTCFFGINIISGWLFLRTSNIEKLLKIIVLWEIFAFIREISIFKVASLFVPRERWQKSLETLIRGEGNDLNLHSLTLAYRAFPGNLPNLVSA